MWLRQWASRNVPLLRRAGKRRWSMTSRTPSLANLAEYRAVLHALRGHGCYETEALLTLAARDWDPAVRTAAVGSLGWWEPLNRGQVLECLNMCRKDVNAEVRQAARAALARLGERQALQWFRQALTSEDPLYVYEATRVAAAEQLTLLWPDLDRLADADNPDVAIHAREALEQMCEEIELRRSFR
jgi:HEAT repeat protein